MGGINNGSGAANANINKKFIPTFKTIKLGTKGLKTPADFIMSLKDSGDLIGDWASNLLDKPEFKTSISDDEIEVDLVILNTAQFTGKDGGTTAEVFIGAERLGFKKCSAEVGPQLRLQYPDQPEDEWLVIGMEPIRHSDGNLFVFCVEHSSSGLWLFGADADPDYFWLAGHNWVFVRPRK